MTNKRRRTKTYPPGIDPAKLPASCNWRLRNKHWYRSYFQGDKRATKQIAGANATMADLWEAMRDPDLPGTSSF